MPALPALPGATFATPSMPAMVAMPEFPSDWGIDPGFGYTHDERPITDCSDLHMRLHNDERPTIQSEERTVTKAEAPVLRLNANENGGIQVQGWDKDTYSVTACKAAVGPHTQELLSQIKLSISSGEVSVSGPHDREDWQVHLLIRTPRGANVELNAHNGPMSFYRVDGNISAHAINGPISVHDCSGSADISAQNGPISFSGTGGKLRLHTENGPISLNVDSSKWNGESLVADAINGPLSLRVPSGFESSFLVESNDNAPMSCRASICSQARKTWDDNHRRIEYGNGAPVIRVSTRNGPVSVD
jgi:hypothetical protein